MAEIGDFGRVDGESVREIVLRSPGGAEARILTLGAAIRSLEVPMRAGGRRPVVLGLESAEAYRANPGHLGVMVGRCANRIGGGGFRLDGRDVRLPINDAGRNTLHGGTIGFTRRHWRLEDATESIVDLSLVSPDGEEGWPGRVDVRLRYALSEIATLSITATATSDAPTPINLTNHTYWSLNGGEDCRTHRLRIAADFYTPVDETTVPTGAILPVAQTPYDFRSLRPIAADFDVAFVLSGPPETTVVAAEAIAPDERLSLHVETDRPTIQLYTAQFLGEARLGDRWVGARGGFCLEAQDFVDAPNKRHFPSVVLRPGEVRRHTTTFRLTPL